MKEIIILIVISIKIPTREKFKFIKLARQNSQLNPYNVISSQVLYLKHKIHMSKILALIPLLALTPSPGHPQHQDNLIYPTYQFYLFLGQDLNPKAL